MLRRGDKLCVVPGCKNFEPLSKKRPTNEHGVRLTFHRVPNLPQDEERLKKWMSAIKIEKKPRKWRIICSEHFRDEDFVIARTGRLRRSIKKKAVPSLKLPAKENTGTCRAKTNSKLKTRRSLTITKKKAILIAPKILGASEQNKYSNYQACKKDTVIVTSSVLNHGAPKLEAPASRQPCPAGSSVNLLTSKLEATASRLPGPAGLVNLLTPKTPVSRQPGPAGSSVNLGTPKLEAPASRLPGPASLVNLLTPKLETLVSRQPGPAGSSVNLGTPKLLKTSLLVTYSKAKPHVCMFCNETFALESGLKSHLCPVAEIQSRPEISMDYFNADGSAGQRVHSEEKMKLYFCKICEKCFPKQKKLQQHIREKHADVEPFRCQLCDRTFTTPGYLRLHEQSHEPRVCQICHARFNFPIQLNNHMKEEHRVHPSSDSNECQLCHRVFSGPAALQAHRKQHKQDKLFTCPLCTEVFFQDCERDIHMQSEHKEKYLFGLSKLKSSGKDRKKNLVTCPHCKRLFLSDSELYDVHIREEHADEHKCATSQDFMHRAQVFLQPCKLQSYIKEEPDNEFILGM